MDAAELRAHCLGFPGAYEDFPFGPESWVFRVSAPVVGARHDRKMFALSSLDDSPLTVSLKCEPTIAVQLRLEHEEITTAYHFNKRHWNGVRLDGDLPEQLILELIEDSYDLVVSTLNKQQRALLGWTRG